MAELERISITIDADLLARLDAWITEVGHGNRSEAIRDMVRARLVARTPDHTVVAASLTVVYDHRQRALAERLIEAAHDHHGLVLSTMHVHLDKDTCMEISALQGPLHELEHYAGHVIGMRGVLHGDLTTMAPVQSP